MRGEKWDNCNSIINKYIKKIGKKKKNQAEAHDVNVLKPCICKTGQCPPPTLLLLSHLNEEVVHGREAVLVREGACGSYTGLVTITT